MQVAPKKDLEQHTLSLETNAAVLDLGNLKARICRRNLQEILENMLVPGPLQPYTRNRCLPHRLGCAPPASCCWNPGPVFAAFGPTEVWRGWRATRNPEDRASTGVRLAILSVTGEEADLVGENIVDALDFHNTVAGQAAAHLHLWFDNTYRNPWLAAKLLSTAKHLARATAKAHLKHLYATKPEIKSTFESCL